MPLATFYGTGTASVNNGATTVTFAGAILGTADFPTIQAGDLFCDPAQPTIPPQRIASVDYNAVTATLAVNWPGTTMTAAPYEVRYVGDTVRSTAQTREVLTELSTVQANGRGLFYTFDTTTSDSDPGAGNFRFNNSTVASATAAYLDNLDADGAPASAIIETWDDSATSANRGQLWVRSISSPSTFYAFTVSGSVVDGTGYQKLTLAYIGGSGTFASGDDLMVFFSAKGDRGDDGIDGASALAKVRAVSSSNITIATALNNGDVIDGVTLATNDLVLVAGQTSASDNGVYVVGPSPARDTSFNTYDAHPGTYFSVMEGTNYADTLWACTSNKGGILGTTALVFVEYSSGLPTVSSRTALKALNTATTTAAVLTEAGRQGTFLWMSGDYSALVAADTAEGVYIKATAVAATSGAWVRIYAGSVSLAWFGAIGDGNIANATVNATALTAALSVASVVFIPYTSSGYHFGTNSFTLGSGKWVIGENAVTLITTTTTKMFYLTGYFLESGISNVTIDGSGAGSSSTIFRAATSLGVVYRVRFDRITVSGAYEVFGDEASSNYVVDFRVTNVLINSPRTTSIYYRHSRGFMYFENIQHALNQGAIPINWPCGKFSDADGLEITRWDVSGGPVPRTSAVTITIASPGVVSWPSHGFSAGDAVEFTTTGALPTGLVAGTTYYVKTVIDANSFTVSATSGGSVINTSGSQSGVHTGTMLPYYQSNGYGLWVDTSTSVWLNRVEVDSTWGNGFLLSTVRFLYMVDCDSFGNLGNAMQLTSITESQAQNVRITGAYGLTGDGGGSGLAIASSSNVVLTNVSATACSASAVIVNNSTNINIGNADIYSNASYAYALLGTTDVTHLEGVFSGNGNTVLNSASGQSNTISAIGYNSPGRSRLIAGRTLYVGANIPTPSISIASPAVVTSTAHGLSAGDPVVFNVPLGTAAATISAANPAVVTMANAFAAGQPITFSSTGSLPYGIVPGTTYYVIATGLSGSQFEFSTTPGGAAVSTAAPTATFTNGSANIGITNANTYYSVGQTIRFATTGSLPTNFATATDYYIVSANTTTITVSATNGGSAIVAGSAGSGTQTAVQSGSHFVSNAGALPTGITAGTVYYVSSASLGTNSFELSDTQAHALAGTNLINTSGSVTGSPVYGAYTGNDSNDGSAQTRSNALLTIQQALTKAAGFDFNGFTVSVQLANGWYNAGGTIPVTVGQASTSGLVIQGNSGTPSNVVISTTSVDCFASVAGARALVKDMELRTTTGGVCIDAIGVGSEIQFSNIRFGACANTHVIAQGGALATCTGNYAITGPAVQHVNSDRGLVEIGSKTITITGDPAFSGQYANAAQGHIRAFLNTYVGTATGTRYSASLNGSIQTFGGGASALPGSVAGATSTGGQYA